ncbi:MAG: Uma2 family endonuclease [Vicinamibacterales bacterium]
MPDQTLPRRATYEDYRQFPDDGKRYEILDGEIYMTPSPSPRHQYVSKRLQRILERYFEDRLGYQVFNSPLDVILADDDIVQPDLLVVADRPQISARGIEGAPIVLIEILSPSRPAYDRLTKARRYAARGVPHYWIVDPEARTVECFRMEGGVYKLDASAANREDLEVPAFTGLTIPLAGLWLDQ